MAASGFYTSTSPFTFLTSIILCRLIPVFFFNLSSAFKFSSIFAIFHSPFSPPFLLLLSFLIENKDLLFFFHNTWTNRFKWLSNADEMSIIIQQQFLRIVERLIDKLCREKKKTCFFSYHRQYNIFLNPRLILNARTIENTYVSYNRLCEVPVFGVKFVSKVQNFRWFSFMYQHWNENSEQYSVLPVVS